MLDAWGVQICWWILSTLWNLQLFYSSVLDMSQRELCNITGWESFVLMSRVREPHHVIHMIEKVSMIFRSFRSYSLWHVGIFTFHEKKWNIWSHSYKSIILQDITSNVIYAGGSFIHSQKLEQINKQTEPHSFQPGGLVTQQWGTKSSMKNSGGKDNAQHFL